MLGSCKVPNKWAAIKMGLYKGLDQNFSSTLMCNIKGESFQGNMLILVPKMAENKCFHNEVRLLDSKC